jgi:hypothetical protein
MQDQLSSGLLVDNERSNGTAYYYDQPDAASCSRWGFGVCTPARGGGGGCVSMHKAAVNKQSMHAVCALSLKVGQVLFYLLLTRKFTHRVGGQRLTLL